MDAQDWWLVGALAGLAAVQAVLLRLLVTTTRAHRDAMHRLEHAMEDMGPSLKEVLAAYNRLLLHNERKQ